MCLSHEIDYSIILSACQRTIKVRRALITHTHEATKTNRGGRPGFARGLRALQLRDSAGLSPASPFSPAIRGTGTSIETSMQATSGAAQIYDRLIIVR
jgi:hypothetical protein